MGELTLVEQVYRRYSPLLEQAVARHGYGTPVMWRLVEREGYEVQRALVRAACREDANKVQAVTP